MLNCAKEIVPKWRIHEHYKVIRTTHPCSLLTASTTIKAAKKTARGRGLQDLFIYLFFGKTEMWDLSTFLMSTLYSSLCVSLIKRYQLANPSDNRTSELTKESDKTKYDPQLRPCYSITY